MTHSIPSVAPVTDYNKVVNLLSTFEFLFEV